MAAIVTLIHSECYLTAFAAALGAIHAVFPAASNLLQSMGARLHIVIWLEECLDALVEIDLPIVL